MDDGGVYKPFDTRFDIKFCPAAEAWQEDEFFQWGHVYCDEFHQACASSYHPDGNVVIPRNLMKGDDHCHFQWIMPPDAQALDPGAPTELGTRLANDYRAVSELEAGWLSLKRSNRLVAGRFVSIARTLFDRHAAAAELVIRNALRAWGRDRGERLRREHEADGRDVGLRSFLEHHEFPMRQIWQPRYLSETPQAITIEFDTTPGEQAWQDLDAMDLGRIWYEETYPAMAEAYVPGMRSKWQSLQTRGEAVNRLAIGAV